MLIKELWSLRSACRTTTTPGEIPVWVMALLRAGSSVTDACVAVGCTSLGSFSARFRAVTGETPSAYRSRGHSALEAMPGCMVRVLSRPTTGAGAA